MKKQPKARTVMGLLDHAYFYLCDSEVDSRQMPKEIRDALDILNQAWVEVLQGDLERLAASDESVDKVQGLLTFEDITVTKSPNKDTAETKAFAAWGW